jgi:hypothetical protein
MFIQCPITKQPTGQQNIREEPLLARWKMDKPDDIPQVLICCTSQNLRLKQGVKLNWNLRYGRNMASDNCRMIKMPFIKIKLYDDMI